MMAGFIASPETVSPPALVILLVVHRADPLSFGISPFPKSPYFFWHCSSANAGFRVGWPTSEQARLRSLNRKRQGKRRTTIEPLLGLFPFNDMPMLFGIVERRIQDGLRDFVGAHGRRGRDARSGGKFDHAQFSSLIRRIE